MHHWFSGNWWSSPSFNADKIKRVQLKSYPESPPENVAPRPGQAADLNLIGPSVADQQVEFAPCCWGSGIVARLEPADPFL